MSNSSMENVAPKSAFALIVGISRYRDERITNLEFTHNDAKAFHDLLLDPQRANFPRENVRLLLDDQATLFNFKNAISGWLFQHARPDSTVLVYFAGHGGEEPDRTGDEPDSKARYLLPWDTDKENLFASALSNVEFDRLLSTVKSRRLVIFLDACHAGGVSQRGARDMGIVCDPFEKLSEGEGRLVIASAKPHQLSWEDRNLGHGIFTYHLLEALRGKADADNDGYVSIVEVYKYLEREVPQSVRHIARAIQEPVLSGDMSRDIYLTASAERVAALKMQSDRAERQRREVVRTKNRILFEMHDGGDLPLEVYQEALLLLEKPEAEMSARDLKLARNLEALLRSGITPQVYLDNRESILSHHETESSQRSADGTRAEPQSTGRPDPDPTGSALQYCIHCGTRLVPQNLFCVGCGKRIQ